MWPFLCWFFQCAPPSTHFLLKIIYIFVLKAVLNCSLKNIAWRNASKSKQFFQKHLPIECLWIFFHLSRNSAKFQFTYCIFGFVPCLVKKIEKILPLRLENAPKTVPWIRVLKLVSECFQRGHDVPSVHSQRLFRLRSTDFHFFDLLLRRKLEK